MKEFDLEAAKAGKKVMTRDGHDARIICFDKQFHGEKNMVVLLQDKLPSGNYNELIRNYKLDGTSIGKNRNEDLVMAPEKKVGWVNIYKEPGGDRSAIGVYHTKCEAEEDAFKGKEKAVATVKLEWEE